MEEQTKKGRARQSAKFFVWRENTLKRKMKFIEMFFLKKKLLFICN